MAVQRRLMSLVVKVVFVVTVSCTFAFSRACDNGDGVAHRAVRAASDKPMVEAENPEPPCSADGWTKQHFISTQSEKAKYPLQAIWGTSGSNVFAIAGGDPTILHYDGSSWASMASDPVKFLCGIWGASSSDIFAVGNPILHYDGRRWSAHTAVIEGWLTAIWGASRSNIFAVGERGNIARFDGSKWSAMNSGTKTKLRAVWGVSAQEVYAVGADGRGLRHDNIVLRYNGRVWSPLRGKTRNGEAEWPYGELNGIWGTSSTNIYVVGDGVWHFDGETWSPEPTEVDGICHWPLELHAESWRMVGPKGLLKGIWGSSRSDLFAVGELFAARPGEAFGLECEGLILRNDGNGRWKRVDSGTSGALLGIWGSSATDVFAIGSLDTILHYDGKPCAANDGK
jgi:hypothetical protein